MQRSNLYHNHKTCGIKQAEDMQRSNLYHNRYMWLKQLKTCFTTTTCLSGCRQRLDRYMSSACFTPHVLVVAEGSDPTSTTTTKTCGVKQAEDMQRPTSQPLRHVVKTPEDMQRSNLLRHVVQRCGSLHVFSLFYTTCLSGCGRGWIATCLQPVLYHMSQWLWQRLDRYMSSACFTPHVLVVVVEVGSLHVFSLFYTTCLSGCGRGWIATCLQPVLQPHVLVVVVEVGSLHVFSLFYTTCLSGCGRGWIATCLQHVG